VQASGAKTSAGFLFFPTQTAYPFCFLLANYWLLRPALLAVCFLHLQGNRPGGGIKGKAVPLCAPDPTARPVVGEGIMKKTQTTPSIADLNAIEANYQLLFKKGAMKTAPDNDEPPVGERACRPGSRAGGTILEAAQGAALIQPTRLVSYADQDHGPAGIHITRIPDEKFCVAPKLSLMAHFLLQPGFVLPGKNRRFHMVDAASLGRGSRRRADGASQVEDSLLFGLLCCDIH